MNQTELIINETKEIDTWLDEMQGATPEDVRLLSACIKDSLETIRQAGSRSVAGMALPVDFGLLQQQRNAMLEIVETVEPHKAEYMEGAINFLDSVLDNGSPTTLYDTDGGNKP